MTMPQSATENERQSSSCGFPRLPAKHIGVLVIHGMGDENSYSTLDMFARGLFKQFGHRFHMSTEWKERIADPAHLQANWTQAQVVFQASAIPPESPETVTVAEYYWSPATKGKIKDLAVLTWLIRTALEPFRYLSENLQVMWSASMATSTGNEVAPTPVDSAKKAPAALLLGREFLRWVFVYVPLLCSFLAIAAALGKATKVGTTLMQVVQNPGAARWGILIALRLLILWAVAGYFISLPKRWQKVKEKGAGGLFFRLGGAVGASAFFAAILIVPFMWSESLTNSGGAGCSWEWFCCWWEWLWHSMARILLLRSPFLQLFPILAELGLAFAVRWFLIDFLGDVAIYTNLNQRSGSFAVRAQILRECGDALTALYQDVRERAIRGGVDPEELGENAFKIVIAAHSLGTVIAYDTVNDLFNRARIEAVAGKAPLYSAPATANEIFGRLRGLLTFGSPLNKTYYFFRDQSEPQALVRSQIIDGLHSFRLRAPDVCLPSLPLEPFPISASLQTAEEEFRWINFWAVADPFSGKLFFYDVPGGCQFHCWYWLPIFAHLKYWKDERMYKTFIAQLL